MGSTVIAGMEMQERKEPELIKFAEGECVEGVLLSIDRAMVGEPKKPVTKFTIETAPGERCSILASYDLATKIHMEDRGHLVSIRYEGEDKSVSRNGNALKRFKVLVSTKPVRTGAALAETMITDADIPF